MAVRIRLTRKGKKKQPTYRVIVADGRSPRDGRYIEQIGRYDPRQEPSIVEIDNDRAAYWLSVGAQPSDAVRKLLEISGALEARPVKIKDAKVHVVDEAAQVEDAEDDAAVIEAAADVDAATTDDATDDEPADEVAAEVADVADEVAAEVADAAEESAEDDTGDDDSLLDKAKDAVAAAAEKVADVVEDVVEKVTGDDDEAESEEESS
ncbi:MAG: 30S ribosomal protein S16 [Acidimicrobiia bacterium]